MATLTVKLLGYGELNSGTETALISGIPGLVARSVVVKNVILTNTGASNDVVVDLYFKRSTDYYRVGPKSLRIAAGEQAILEDEITLDIPTSAVAADYLLAQRTSGTNAITYLVNGIERTV
jgi:hypothetical protein